MKIATWNLQRLEKRKNQVIIEKLIEIDADILILTETNSIVQLNNYNSISTEILPENFENIVYKKGENRVTILTKYKITARHKTFDNYTTVCADVETPYGLLTIYGSIIGVFANRQPRFDDDLYGQISDFERIFKNRNVCFAGDLNVTFSGYPWPSKKVREILIDTFERFQLINTTDKIPDTVDHIVLSKDFLMNKNIEIITWNKDKNLSDHVGHLLILNV